MTETFAFWGKLSSDDQENLESLGTIRSFASESEIIRQDDEARFVLIVRHGCVKVVARDSSGYQAVLALRYAGDVVGEMAILDGAPRSAGVFTVGEVTALVLRAGDFQDYLREHREVAKLLQACLAARLRESDQLRATATRPVPARLAGLLLRIAGREGRHAPDGSLVIALPLTQDDLAGLLSVSRRTVARAMQSWRNADLVLTARRSIVIKKAEKLSQIAE
jgi:CRP/FNR family cyclic AMP-dependent transcriptional regulator